MFLHRFYVHFRVVRCGFNLCVIGGNVVNRDLGGKEDVCQQLVRPEQPLEPSPLARIAPLIAPRIAPDRRVCRDLGDDVVKFGGRRERYRWHRPGHERLVLGSRISVGGQNLGVRRQQRPVWVVRPTVKQEWRVGRPLLNRGPLRKLAEEPEVGRDVVLSIFLPRPGKCRQRVDQRAASGVFVPAIGDVQALPLLRPGLHPRATGKQFQNLRGHRRGGSSKPSLSTTHVTPP